MGKHMGALWWVANSILMLGVVLLYVWYWRYERRLTRSRQHQHQDAASEEPERDDEAREPLGDASVVTTQQQPRAPEQREREREVEPPDPGIDRRGTVPHPAT